MMKLNIFAFVAIVTVVLLSCKAEEGKEEAIFNDNISQIRDLTSKFPRYSKLVNEHLLVLDVSWNKALSISDENQKNEALQDINKSFKSGTISSLFDLEKEIENVKDNLHFLEMHKASELENDVINKIDDAHEVLVDVKLLVNGDSILSDVSAAISEVEGLVVRLKKSNKAIQIPADKLKVKEAKEEAARKERAAKKAAEKAAAKAEVQDSTSTENGELEGSEEPEKFEEHDEPEQKNTKVKRRIPKNMHRKRKAIEEK